MMWRLPSVSKQHKKSIGDFPGSLTKMNLLRIVGGDRNLVATGDVRGTRRFDWTFRESAATFVSFKRTSTKTRL